MKKVHIIVTLVVLLSIAIFINYQKPYFYERLLAPGYGTCEKCNRPWKYAQEHTTWYTENSAIFALCEPCWKSLGIAGERLPYYQKLMRKWIYSNNTVKKAVETAVLNEK